LRLERVRVERADATATAFRALTALGGPVDVQFAGCQLTDADLAALAQKPTSIKSLIILNAPKVTDAGLKHLEKVRSLTGLAIRVTSVTPDELKAFWRARPDVKDLAPKLIGPLPKK
jgi:hypothetical protein